MLARKSLKCLFSLFVCISLFSCENFYDGEKFLNQLEQSIDYANAKQAKVTIVKNSNDDTAVLEPVGRITNERLGYSFKITYTPCSTYTFVKWAALKDDGTEFSAEEVLFEDSSAMETNVTVNTEEQVTIQAVSVPKVKLTLNFDIPNYPYDKRSFDVSETFYLAWQDFTANYAFLGWQVYDTATNQLLDNYEEYISFANVLSGNTEVTVHKTGKMLTIRGIIQQYPKIISATPVNEAGGVSKDTPIRVRFNQPLSSETLYYESESELPEGAIPLKATVDGTERLYGYVGGGGTVVFKCAKIVKLNEEDTSFLNSFDCPYISPYDNTSLIIPVKFSSPSEIKENSNVLVIINPGVGVACNNSLGKKVNIGLLEPFSWSYVTNAQTDNAGPVFNTCEVSIVKKSGDVLSLVESQKDLGCQIADFITKYALSEKKLKAKIRFSDNGVGPDSLVATICKVEKSAYSDKPFTFDPVEKPVDIHITGISANACTLKDNQYLDECYIDLSDIPPEMESIFSIQFTAKDKKKQEQKSDIFYFVYDFTPPKNTFPFGKHSDAMSSVIRLSKSEGENIDEDLNRKSIEINGKLFDQDMYLASITKNGKYYKWSNKITYTVTVTDYAGNSVTTNDTYTNTYYPEVGNYFYSDGSWSSFYSKPPLKGYLPEGVEEPKLVGVITDIPEKDGKKDYSNVTVFHNQMLEGSYCLVPFTSKDKVKATQHNTSDGTVYDDGLTVKNYYKQFSDIYYSGTRVTKSNEKTDSLPSLYYYLDHVFTSPDDPNHLDWYLPSVSEFIGIGSSCLDDFLKNGYSVYGVPTCSTAATLYYNYTSMTLESTRVITGTSYSMFGNLVEHNPPDNYDCIISKVIPAAQVDLTKYY